MKYIIRNKPRKIVIGDKCYVFVISIDNDLMTSSIIFLKIFLKDFKKTPLIFRFNASNNPSNPLYSGVTILNVSTQTEETINIHKPKWVRKFIEEGVKMGWTGQNKLDYQDGNTIIESWGYDIFNKVNEWDWETRTYQKSSLKK
jgi:hypothetical protein